MARAMTEEQFKGCVHLATANLATTMCLYNALAYVTRRERRLAINVLIYGCLLGFESYQTVRHFSTGYADRRSGG